jgi:hypothetical protein
MEKRNSFHLLETLRDLGVPYTLIVYNSPNIRYG